MLILCCRATSVLAVQRVVVTAVGGRVSELETSLTVARSRRLFSSGDRPPRRRGLLDGADLPIALDVHRGDLVDGVDVGRLPHALQQVAPAEPASRHGVVVDGSIAAEVTVLALD